MKNRYVTDISDLGSMQLLVGMERWKFLNSGRLSELPTTTDFWTTMYLAGEVFRYEVTKFRRCLYRTVRRLMDANGKVVQH